MKNQIITFVIGVLVGAIITTSVFLIIKPSSSKKVPNFSGTNRNGERVRPNTESNKKDKAPTEKNTTKNENKDKTNAN